jgi:hypothetical protein
LYLKLKCNQWKNFVTSDEEMFYLGRSYGWRKVCYIRQGENIGDNLKFVKCDAFASSFMACAGVSFIGKTEIRIINKRTKVNSELYIYNVLKPFLEKVANRSQKGTQGGVAQTWPENNK